MVTKTPIEKDGVVMTTKDGVELIDYRLESGDIFVPQHNTLLEKSQVVEVEEKGKMVKKTIFNYKLKIVVKDYNDDEPIFVTLTPSQAKSLNKKIADAVVLNQHLFCAYTYKDKEGNEWVGVGFKNKNLPPKTFNDFDDILNESSEKVVEVEEVDAKTKE